jgi:hypothetical protein
VRIVALAAVGLACHGGDHPVQSVQSEADALSRICDAPDWSTLSPAERDTARDRWADAQITNPEMRRFVATLAERDAWDGMTQVLLRADAAKLASCKPHVFSGARAPNRDLRPPTIKDTTNVKFEAVPSVTVTATDHAAFAPALPVGTTAVMIVADAGLRLRDLTPVLEPLHRVPIDRFKLAVIDDGKLDALTFGFQTPPSTTPMIVVHASGIALDGKELADADVRAATKTVGLAAITFDPDLGVQRLAEVLSEVAVPVIVAPPSKVEPSPPAPAPDMSSCTPLELRFDGKPLQLKALLARGHSNGGIEVVLSNKSLTCADLLKQARPITDDEITMEVIVKRDPHAVALVQVVFDNDIEDSSSRLLRTPPSKAGDTVDVCIGRAMLRGHATHRGHEVEAIGLAHATYCGELK